MKAKDFDVQKIIDHIEGTCTESIQSALDAHYPDMTEDDLDESDFDDIANSTFLCNGCGWCFEAGEEDEEGNCIDCQDDNEE